MFEIFVYHTANYMIRTFFWSKSHTTYTYPSKTFLRWCFKAHLSRSISLSSQDISGDRSCLHRNMILGNVKSLLLSQGIHNSKFIKWFNYLLIFTKFVLTSSLPSIPCSALSFKKLSNISITFGRSNFLALQNLSKYVSVNQGLNFPCVCKCHVLSSDNTYD